MCSSDLEGVTYESGDSEAVIDLTRSIGRAEVRMDDARAPGSAGAKLVAIELKGFSTRSAAQISKLDVAGAINAGGGQS